MPDALYYEDFPPGEVAEYGGVDVSAEEIVAFAHEFDPQPFHIDEEAARALTGGLIASGWHTCALLLGMNCEAFLARAAVLEEAGIEEVRWERPVRPGDRLHVRRHTLAKRPRDGRAGEIAFLFEVVDQDGAVAMTQRSLILIEKRPQPAEPQQSLRAIGRRETPVRTDGLWRSNPGERRAPGGSGSPRPPGSKPGGPRDDDFR